MVPLVLILQDSSAERCGFSCPPFDFDFLSYCRHVLQALGAGGTCAWPPSSEVALKRGVASPMETTLLHDISSREAVLPHGVFSPTETALLHGVRSSTSPEAG